LCDIAFAIDGRRPKPISDLSAAFAGGHSDLSKSQTFATPSRIARGLKVATKRACALHDLLHETVQRADDPRKAFFKNGNKSDSSVDLKPRRKNT
jgi:hypothetical protein